MGSSSAYRALRAIVFAGISLAVAHGTALAACAPDQLDLRWDGGQARFTVELADTEATRARGLMFREKMAASAGMLFVYDSARRATFWMKDTLIPLDLVFAGPDGVVTLVHANAKPKDTSTIDGGAGVKFVLEINGGLAARMGIAPGAQMRHAAIDAPAWPCAAE
jgi:hypothetical protein